MLPFPAVEYHCSTPPFCLVSSVVAWPNSYPAHGSGYIVQKGLDGGGHTHIQDLPAWPERTGEEKAIKARGWHEYKPSHPLSVTLG